jgi:hypothetical protein
MAKIGQLYLQGGEWNGNRIVSQEWVAESTGESIQVPPSESPRQARYVHRLLLQPVEDAQPILVRHLEEKIAEMLQNRDPPILNPVVFYDLCARTRTGLSHSSPTSARSASMAEIHARLFLLIENFPPLGTVESLSRIFFAFLTGPIANVPRERPSPSPVSCLRSSTHRRKLRIFMNRSSWTPDHDSSRHGDFGYNPALLPF